MIVVINKHVSCQTLRMHGIEKQLSGIDLDVGRANPSAEHRESMGYNRSLLFDRHSPDYGL